MDQPSLEAALADLNLSAIRYFPTIDSTNSEASRWIDKGAPHLALVVADQQTCGRGRAGRHWVTMPGAGLAFSLVLLFPPLDSAFLSRLTGLGALAVQQALLKKYAPSSQIKWPNDVLLDGSKVAGILVEARWSGEALQSAIIGIGINIAPESVSEASLPLAGLEFPATCVEWVTRKPVNRIELLHGVLHELLFWLPKLDLSDFLSTWESVLAYRNQWAELSSDITPSLARDGCITTLPVQGKVLGLTWNGSLKFLTSIGELVIEAIGDIRLRPTQIA